MLMRRRTRLVTMLLLVTTACGRDAMSPPSELPNPPFARTVEGYTVDVHLTGDTVLTTFVINPAVNASYSINRTHKLWLRAGAICNPLTSGYGPRYWYQPCEPLTVPITIVAKSWRDESDHPRIDFTPELRFTPLQGKRAAAAHRSGSRDAVRYAERIRLPRDQAFQRLQRGARPRRVRAVSAPPIP